MLLADFNFHIPSNAHEHAQSGIGGGCLLKEATALRAPADQGARHGPLSAAETRAIDELGYVVLDGVLSSDELTAMRAELNRLVESEGPFVGAVSLSRWQRVARAPDTRRGLRGRVAGFIHRGLMRLAQRWLFRWRPGFKAGLQDRIARPAPANSWWGRLKAEAVEACYVAAVQEAGALRVCNLVNKSEQFDRCITDARVLAAVGRVLGPRFKVSSLNFRAALPGGGLQPLHVDWDRPVPPGEYFACNTLWVLDDFIEDNGPTRIVPGSHLSHALPPGDSAERIRRHPQEQRILARAGSVIVLNSHVWHGGTLNRTDRMRRILQCYFVTPDQRPQLDQGDAAEAATLHRLTPAARRVLGVAALAAADQPSC